VANFYKDDNESEISIPKRDWGEKFIQGVDQHIDEEFGIEFEESIASLEEEVPLSKLPATSINTKSSASSGSDIEQKLSTSNLPNSSSSNNKKKSKQKKNKVLKKTKKSKEDSAAVSSLPPLKGGLPPLKTRPLLGDLPPLRGAPIVPMMEQSSNTTINQIKQQPPVSEPKLNTLTSQGSERSLTSTPQNAMKRQSSHKSTVTAVKSQRSSMLGDLPPLFGVKPSTDTANGMSDEEKSDEDDDGSMGDIDALLQGLDDFDAKKTNKSQR